ncbi:MAG TPA: hypothetical protein VHK63_03595 [Candidatus Limnocylindria bacterium]|nr:hypothetical protein [Candidatus Limnocylindria bacterium]
MREELETILRLVADGKLSADEAAPIIEALSAPRRRPEHMPGATGEQGEGHDHAHQRRRVRIQVNERGRRVVDLRVPLAFAAAASRMVPGIPDSYANLIERAVDSDTLGTIVDVEDESGDGVVISLE